MSTPELVREVAELLYGGGADEMIAKMSPTQSDVHAHGGMSDKKKRQITAGLSAVGAAAGAAGLTLGGHNVRRSYKVARAAQKGAKFAAPGAKRAAFKTAIGRERLATGLVPLEVAGLTGEIAATKILHGDTKKKKPVRKSANGVLVRKYTRSYGVGKNSKGTEEIIEQASLPSKHDLTRAVITTAPRAAGAGLQYSRKAKGRLARLPNKVESTKSQAKVVKALLGNPPEFMRYGKEAPQRKPPANPTLEQKARRKRILAMQQVNKSDDVDVLWEGEIAKADSDKQQVFGWASVVEVAGEPVVDLQGDFISTDEMEKAAYEYVMKSRKGGDMHLRDEWKPVSKSEMIESFIVTPEKREAMGMPDSVPSGWWVGFQVRDPDVWAKVRSGERTGFSIHGRGKRTPL